ncbi:amidohydrolase family protein [Botrimarina mediterranea]|uniref:N-substituted formamide deformylase n=1 Tax=Botrimarina mediterranea TaxID=2528022 RepID=A0A518KBP0_9BACT|nr:amidohydrolase family protein [Botrimarina mediterranea]QDV75214.1 N-substituted formamide deformylase precursor [Botrimarina mediterranea]
MKAGSIALLILIVGSGIAANGHESPEHAIKAIDRKLAVEGGNSRLLVRRGDELRAIGHFAQAIASYRDALQFDPHSPNANLGLSRTLLAAGDFAECRAVVDSALPYSDDITAASLHAVLAEAASMQGDNVAALAAWEQAIRSPSPEVDWLLAHAETAGRVEGPKAKRLALEAARRRNPSVVLHREAIATLIECGDTSAARSMIQAGLQQSHWKRSWLLLRASAYERDGDLEHARRDLAVANAEALDRLANRPENPALLRQLEEVRMRQAALAADLVIVNARVITMDEETPPAEAIAIKDGRITAVGADEAIREHLVDDTEVLDAQGRVVLPGFIDAHIHPSPTFDELSPYGVVACGPEAVSSIDELIERLRRKAEHTPSGEWVRGRGYQDTKLGRHPTRLDLDQASTAHPIYIVHSSGHVAVANSYALSIAGITRETADPPGGAFDRDSDGEPNGVLRESAKGRISDSGPEPPEPSLSEWIEGMRRTFARYNRVGITSIHDAGINPDKLRRYQAFQSEEPQVRVYAMLRRRYLDDLQETIVRSGRGDAWLRIGAVKDFHGNSLSGRTCWLYGPYADRPGYHGIPPATSQEKLNARILAIHEAGLQACIHANGDREIDMVLDAFEAALQQSPRDDHRHRIEHASVVNQSILERVKRLGIVLAPHSYIWEHGDKMEAFGESRWPWMHPNGSAIRMGIPVAGTSDSPVSEARPMLRIQSMVTRTSAEGKCYGPEQAVTIDEAIRAWTWGGAFASFQEEEKGSLKVGKIADLVVLSRDPWATPPNELKDIEVDCTVVGGRIVHDVTRLE